MSPPDPTEDRGQNAAPDESPCLARVRQAARAAEKLTTALEHNDERSSDQIQGNIDELTALVATLVTWRHSADGQLAVVDPECSTLLELVIAHLERQLQTFRLRRQAARTLEEAQRLRP